MNALKLFLICSVIFIIVSGFNEQSNCEEQNKPKTIGFKEPKSLTPLAVGIGNRWTYQWKSSTAQSQSKDRGRIIYLCKHEYMFGGKSMWAVCYHYSTDAHEPHQETYCITRKSGNNYLFTVTSKPNVPASQIRDGRYEDSKENCLTVKLAMS